MGPRGESRQANGEDDEQMTAFLEALLDGSSQSTDVSAEPDSPASIAVADMRTLAEQQVAGEITAREYMDRVRGLVDMLSPEQRGMLEGFTGRPEDDERTE